MLPCPGLFVPPIGPAQKSVYLKGRTGLKVWVYKNFTSFRPGG